MTAVSPGFLKQFVKKLPFIWDCYAYFIGFHRKVAVCRGVFNSVQEAKSAASQGMLIGYNQSTIRNLKNVAKITAQREYDELDIRDEPILKYLESLLRPDSKVFNLGGNVGTEYYAYRRRVNIPDGVRWTVCEVPEIAEAGRRLAAEKGESQLDFVTDFSLSENSDIFLTCGALQYIEQNLGASLLTLSVKPSHVLINRTAMYDGTSFVTLQNLGYANTPYIIRNRDAFIRDMGLAGYQLVSTWRDSRVTRIPFHPRHTVRGYCGFYFVRL
jgi:putative methyltransferase (TIGR04325 family)